jgi:pimeloyl-ACP methyl ester carboxylesterase
MIPEDDLPESFAVTHRGPVACIERAARGGAPTWLLIHGWLCDRWFWTPFLSRLPETHGAVACDLPGHGDTPPPAAWSLAALTGTAEDLARQLSDTDLILVGHSMGGFVAQRLAAALGKALNRLVLVTTAGGDTGGLISVRLARTSERFDPAAFDNLFPTWFGPDAEPEVFDFVGEVMLDNDWRFGRALALDYADFDGAPLHPSISARTLVVGAAADGSTAPAQSVALAEAIDGAELAIVERCGHFPMLEKPDQFTQILLEWETGTTR